MCMQQNSFQFKKKDNYEKYPLFVQHDTKKNTMRMRKDHPNFDSPLKM